VDVSNASEGDSISKDRSAGKAEPHEKEDSRDKSLVIGDKWNDPPLLWVSSLGAAGDCVLD